MSKVIAFLKNESGATAIEYGLIAAGISVVIIAAVNDRQHPQCQVRLHLAAAQITNSRSLGSERPPPGGLFFL
jgi:Flp pilus assembly pilin Flp